jgi:hypothetical protein
MIFRQRNVFGLSISTSSVPNYDGRHSRWPHCDDETSICEILYLSKKKTKENNPKNAHAFLNRQVSQSLARYVFSSVFWVVRVVAPFPADA